MTPEGGLFILIWMKLSGISAQPTDWYRGGKSGNRDKADEKMGQGLKPAGIFITDFDGTLVRSDGTVAPTDLRALSSLKHRGVVRVVATGRSLYSFHRSRVSGLAVDYVVFSCGAGIMKVADRRVIRKKNLSASRVRQAVRLLNELGLDFMLHREIPENHYFLYRRAGGHNPDFESRIALYRPFCRPLDGEEGSGPACQLLAVLPGQRGDEIFKLVSQTLADFSVIRTTSPLDHRSVWIEIFAPGVSKSGAVEWLAGQLGIGREKTMAVGNDYNDCDLLQWAGEGVVVANAPEELRRAFPKVASNDECGVAEAVSRCRLWN